MSIQIIRHCLAIMIQLLKRQWIMQTCMQNTEFDSPTHYSLSRYVFERKLPPLN